MKQTKQIGKLGEDIACQYLIKRGYEVIQRNYLKKWGEIDIIASKDAKTYFIEVKAVTSTYVNHETSKGEFRAEDNISPSKIKKLKRIIQTYIHDFRVKEGEWGFIAALVRLDYETRMANVRLLQDLVL